MHSDTENKYKGVANGEMLPAIASSLACTLGYNSRSRYEGTFRQGSETRLRIICTAADLFHKQGARATSPDDIIGAGRTRSLLVKQVCRRANNSQAGFRALT